jgi:hypothetical protein
MHEKFIILIGGIEFNRLVTYDVKVIELNEEQIRIVNMEICNSLK